MTMAYQRTSKPTTLYQISLIVYILGLFDDFFWKGVCLAFLTARQTQHQPKKSRQQSSFYWLGAGIRKVEAVDMTMFENKEVPQDSKSPSKDKEPI